MVVPCHNSKLVETLGILRNVVNELFGSGLHLADLDPFIRRTLIETIRLRNIDCGGSLIVQTLPFQGYGVVVTCRFNTGNVGLSDKRNAVLFP